MDCVIQAEGLKKRFNKTKTQALDGVDIAVPQGTVLGVLGPNGAGKTTMVRILSTLIAPDEGRASICGYDVVRQAVQVRQVIALTGQYASVDEELTGEENLLMIGWLCGFNRAETRRRAASLLEQFDLTAAARRAVKTYSGGMRRRLDLAASLVSRPAAIFLDEPTTGLDPYARNKVRDLVTQLVVDGTTVLLTTQYLEEADTLADQIVVIDRGKVIANGTSEDLKAKIGHQTVAVRAVDRARTPDVAKAVEGVTGTEPEVNHGTGRVTAAVTDPAVLSALLRRLDDLDVVAAELALRMPSLDEVFLTLTGHHTEMADAVPSKSLGEGSPE